MDNMLYIIAGLVLILLVAVMVLRKNKAQKPAQRPTQTGRNAAANAPISKHNADRHSTAQRDPNSVNKFDNTAIAQRFMDQQRYDKAIETLDRGLIEKPNDSQLLLKLLSVYATIDQPDDFYKVYDAIKTHSDAATLAEADELKSLVAEEHNPGTSSVIPAANNNSDNAGSLDFDLPTAQTDNENINKDSVFDTATAETNTSPEIAAPTERSEPFDDQNDVNATDSNADDAFELTLGDLETVNDLDIVNNSATNTDESVATNLMPVDQIDTNEEESSATNDLITIENTEDDDFTLDFDLPEQATTPTDHTPVDTEADSSSLEETSLDDDDFVLDFADLAADSDIDTGTVADTDTDTESNAITDAPVQVPEDDFTLSLEDTDLTEIESKSQINAPAAIEETSSEETSITPTTSPTFDDTTFIDDDFDFDFDEPTDSPTATTPVEVEGDDLVSTDVTSDFEGDIESDIENASDSVDTETAADFASRFAADFDFVKTLDSNQVTLDLASQYLKLGEYDSAKRLLNEVMTQGNSEQQQQAQALLERTA